MKKLLMRFVLLFVIAGFSYGESIIIDTTVGSYLTASSTLMWYRDTGVTLTKLPMNTALRVSHKVYDGFALTGTQNNYRITGQLSMNMDSLVLGIGLQPFGGASFNSSTAVASSISVNAGLDASLKNISLAGFNPVLGGEALFFSDSVQIEYYAGFETSLISGLKAAALYSAILESSQHKIGFGAKVSYAF